MIETPKDISTSTIICPGELAPAPKALPMLWRAQAAQYEADGLEAHGRLLRRLAGELEHSLTAHGDTLVSLTEAARRSGYAADSLARMVRDGRLTNYGRKHAPRVRLADLPLRPPRRGVESASRHRLTVAREAVDHYATSNENHAA